MNRISGTVKRIVMGKAFGFIQADGGDELFFHKTACRNRNFEDIKEGDRVEFELGRGDKGPRAEEVTVI